MTFNLSLPEAKYPTAPQICAFTATLRSRLQAEPGVEAAAAIFGLPFAGDFSASTSFSDPAKPDTADGPSAGMRVVTPDYFKTMKIPLVAGRLFDATTTSRRRGRAHQPADGAPLLRRTRIRSASRFASACGWSRDVRSNSKTIVGIVGDVKYGGLDAETPPEVYLPYAQHPVDEFTIAVRTAGDPMAFAPTLRRDVAALDRELPIAKIEPMTAVIGASIAERRFTMLLLDGVRGGGGRARRDRHLRRARVPGQPADAGDRRAAGDRRHAGRRRRGCSCARARALTLVGVVCRPRRRAAATRALATLLFGVRATDPATFAAVAGALAMVALLPATSRRGARRGSIRWRRCETSERLGRPKVVPSKRRLEPSTGPSTRRFRWPASDAAHDVRTQSPLSTQRHATGPLRLTERQRRPSGRRLAARESGPVAYLCGLSRLCVQPSSDARQKPYSGSPKEPPYRAARAVPPSTDASAPRSPRSARRGCPAA